MATASATLSITGVSRLDSRGLRPGEFKKSGLNTSQLSFPLKAVASKPRRSLSVSAQYEYADPQFEFDDFLFEYIDESRSGGGDFVAGFILGGALFGTLAYVFAPQIRKSILNEDEYGFRRAKRPIYYDEGLEKTRQTLNAKISQLNSAIDNVSSRLRGGNNAVRENMETDSEVEATM
ncbi:hypothetical protein QJS10_CPA01g02907 [Acorus calamus]|uniref:Uncharacterized protein n=1 Tax=Acorus calamus TaxID=4465 RepID=A0AAV9FJR5_ACOCL|nr:hypothetical protein QJS10_CPA01g02907 [Acorus calamus]